MLDINLMRVIPGVLVQDGGVVIAEVQADDEAHGITVEDHESIDIYQSTKELKISGQGFLTDTKVRHQYFHPYVLVVATKSGKNDS